MRKDAPEPPGCLWVANISEPSLHQVSIVPAVNYHRNTFVGFEAGLAGHIAPVTEKAVGAFRQGFGDAAHLPSLIALLEKVPVVGVASDFAG